MYQNHASIARIQEHVSINSPFKFTNVSVGEVKSLLRNIDFSKATGYDTIPPKLVKAAGNELAQPISSLVNRSLSLSRFPHELKKSETSPLYKGQNNLEPQNYRPLSVLTCLSKIFERVYNDQMGVYFKDILSTLLSAFRKRYGCPHVLTKLMEYVKQALDEGENVGLLCKLNAYGVSYDACSLIKSYLCQRLQRVKVASARSQWQIMQKGVPQGSVLGPLLFNIFINDIIYELQGVCSLHNYADDNTICCSHSDMNILKINLEKSANLALKWFENNHMKANPSKFQAILFKCRKNEEVFDLNIGDELIKPVSLVKLLGVLIDDKLSFNEHVSKLCIKAARQTNALRRIVKYIPNECRLNIYQAFISSNFNYCDIVWHFCSNRSTYKIEKVHKNALRVTLNDYTSSYSDMLDVVKRPTLYISRIKNIAIETFKSVKGLNPEYMRSLFSFSTTPYCTRGGSKLVQPKVNTIGFGINSFTYQGSKIWNYLPQGVKDTTCQIACKNLIVQWEGPTCKCGFCIMCNMSKIKTPLFLRIILLWCVFTCDWHMYMYIDICFRPGNPVLGMKSDQVIVSLVGFHICMYYSYSCFVQFSPFNHTIIPHLYIFTPIFIVSPNSLGLMLFVCSWCDKKIKFILSYLILSSYSVNSNSC